MIRLIATDIDGTLLPEGTTELDPHMYEVIRRLKGKGIRFAAASGRGYASVSRLFEPVLQDITILAENGGYAQDGDKVLFCKALDESIVRDVLEYAREEDSLKFYMIAGPREQYTECKNETFIQWMKQGYGVDFRQVEDLFQIAEDKLMKVALFFEGDAAAQAPKLRKIVGNRANVTASGDHWVDVNALEADKGKGLVALQTYYGVQKEETMAFGDNMNDIPMLLAAGESYAVEEARPEVIKAAGKVAGKMREGAVLQVLEELLISLEG